MEQKMLCFAIKIGYGISDFFCKDNVWNLIKVN